MENLNDPFFYNYNLSGSFVNICKIKKYVKKGYSKVYIRDLFICIVHTLSVYNSIQGYRLL